MESQKPLDTVDARLSLPEGTSPKAFPMRQAVRQSLSSQAPVAALHQCDFCSKLIAKVSFEQGSPEPDPTVNRREDFIYNLQIDCNEALEAAGLGCQLFQYMLSAGEWDLASPIYLEQSIHDASDQAFPKTIFRGLTESQQARPWLLTEHDEFLDWYESELPWFSLFAPKGLLTLSICTLFFTNSD